MKRFGIQVEVDIGQTTGYLRNLLQVPLVVDVAAHLEANPMDSACLYPRDHVVDEIVSQARMKILPSGGCYPLPFAHLRFER